MHFNDWYYKFIVWSLYNRLQPTHVFVLGDLISNENLDIYEFMTRVGRYHWIFDQVANQFKKMITLILHQLK